MAKDTTIGTAYLKVKAKADDTFSSALEKMGGEAGDSSGILFNNKFASQMKKLPVVMAALGIGKLIGDFLADSIDTGKAFDKAMSQVAATMGTTVGEIQNLRDFAQDMGASTAFSATQAAEALNYMALAGYDADKSMRMLPQVLNLAASGNMELARASDMVTDAQSALGLSIEETEAMVDQMAKTASTTNTSVEQLGDAFLTVGGTAKMLKGGTNELAQALGLLADNGIKGSEGGTALRNMLLSLASPTAEGAEQIKKLGVDIFDAEGNMRSMQEIILDLNAAMADMTSEERTNAISAIFNKRDLKSVEALLGTTAERWNEVADAIDNAQGAAEQMANTQLDNLAGDMTLLQSATEGLYIKISDVLAPALRSVAQFATNLVSGITGFFSQHKDVFDSLANILSGALKNALEVVGVAFSYVGEVIGVVFDILSPFIDLISQIFGKLSEAFAGMAGSAEEGTSVIRILGDVLGIVANIIAAVITPVVNILCTAIDGVSYAVGTLADWFGDLWDTAKEIWDGIVSTVEGAIEKIKSFFDFKLEFPHIEMPHFGVSGAFSADPPSVPDFYVQYYAKGGIITDPHLIVAGEAGPEAIVPLTAPNIAPFADAVAARVQGRGDTYITMNVTADSTTTLDSLINQARRARTLQGAY